MTSSPTVTQKVTTPVWGTGVRTLRGVRQMTQEQLAAAAGTSQSTISDLELGRTGIPDALRIRIARALGVRAHELFPYLDEHGNVA